MQRLNVEIKARCADPAAVCRQLREYPAEFIGVDHQIDTYFQVPDGRLKLREGPIETALIYYRRADQAGPKRSDVRLYQPAAGAALRELLTEALGVRVVIDKHRHIFFIGNVKFHVDEVRGLGSFVEIEAIDRDGSIGEARLREQCDYFLHYLGIQTVDLVEGSYSDLISNA